MLIDKLYLVRFVLVIVQNQIQNNYIPYQDASVDEAMIAFRGCLSFWQYLPSKPTDPWDNETREVELGKKLF